MKNSSRFMPGAGIDIVYAGALVFMMLMALYVFRAHVLGHATFPWDFQGGYYAHAVARLRDGSFMAPPLWLPWGGFGLPGHMSLQDGTWYLPQYLYAAIDGYDLVGATRLQVLHVLLASLGMFALCRSFGLSRTGAFVAACGYLFSGSFFSNAQHVDIVRGAALLPWLIYALHQLWKHGTAFWFLLFVLVCWQLIVGAYPGVVVSSGYLCAALVLILASRKPAETDMRLSRVLLIGIGSLCAAALASVKYLPALLDVANVRQSVEPAALANASIFSTLVFDYDVAFLPNDVTMRDLFLPTALFYLAAIGVRRDQASVFGVVAITIALVFMVDIGWWQSLVSMLPGARISRFPLSDFRPLLHIGTCLLAASCVTQLVRGDTGTMSRWMDRTILFTLVLLALAWYGLRLGHTRPSLYWALASTVVTALVCVAAIKGLLRPPIVHAAFFGVALLVLAHGRQHVLTNARAWNVERNDTIERNLYGDTLRNLVSIDRFKALEWRPARLVFNQLPVVSKRELIDGRYQLGWVTEQFSAFGYENFKFMPALRRLYDAARTNATPRDRASLDWMLRRSAILVLPGPGEISKETLATCKQPVCRSPAIPDVDIRMQQFRENGAVYEIASGRPFFFIENEAMYPGWASFQCMKTDCHEGPDAVAANGFLRGWPMPAGHYRLITYYRPPGWMLASVLAWIGAGIALVLALFLAYSRMSVRRDPALQREGT
ncbi:MAG: hypothetical protein LH470_01810 [Lysobacter sp.]|nr:hypothetical protein [Lysobacter sp.]